MCFLGFVSCVCQCVSNKEVNVLKSVCGVGVGEEEEKGDLDLEEVFLCFDLNFGVW